MLQRNSFAMVDAEAQDDELMALQSIYLPSVFSVVEDAGVRGGQFVASPQLTQPFHVVTRTGDDKSSKIHLVEYLPPITLHFQLPHNYPSGSPPTFTLSCKWLNREQLTKLCEALDQIWEENKAEVVLFLWTQFLNDESLQTLGITDSFDLSLAMPLKARIAVHRSAEKLSQLLLSSSVDSTVAVTNSDVVPQMVPGGELRTEGVQCDSQKELACRGRGRYKHNHSLKSNGGSGRHGFKWENYHIKRRHDDEQIVCSRNKDEKQTTEESPREVDDSATSRDQNGSASSETYTEPVVAASLSGARSQETNCLLSTYHHDAAATINHCVGDSKKVDRRAVQDVAPDVQLLPIILEYDQQQRQQAFNSSLFLCAVCFEEKLGSQCLAFKGCEHVFCRACLRSYFEVQITSGNVQKLICPDEKCTSEALPTQVREIVDQEMYKRYDSLLLATTLDTMSDVMYCPRRTCQYPVIVDADSTMASCAACGYVFCIYCKLAYHGLVPCRLRPGEQRILCDQYLEAGPKEKREMEQRYGRQQIKQLVDTFLSEDWIHSNSKSCPHCNANIEKSDGCNKMTCRRCGSNFCWLCLTRLNLGNPYSHYSDPSSRCANQLFQGVDEGDEENDWEFGQYL